MTGDQIPLEVQVLVAHDHRGSMDELASALTDAGLRDASSLGSIGVITGSVDGAAGVEALRAVAGVEDVREGRQVEVPSPDEPVQ